MHGSKSLKCVELNELKKVLFKKTKTEFLHMQHFLVHFLAVTNTLYIKELKQGFDRRTSTGSEPFSLFISLDATIFVLLSVLILIETIYPKIWSNHGSRGQKVHFRLTCVAQKRRCLSCKQSSKTDMHIFYLIWWRKKLCK